MLIHGHREGGAGVAEAFADDLHGNTDLQQDRGVGVAAMKRVTEIERSEAGEPFAPDFLTIKEAADLVRIGRARPIGTVPGNNTERPARSVPAVNTGWRSSTAY